MVKQLDATLLAFFHSRPVYTILYNSIIIPDGDFEDDSAIFDELGFVVRVTLTVKSNGNRGAGRDVKEF